MSNPFRTQHMAEGYARSRPAVHPHILERVRTYLGGPVRRALDVGCGAGLSTQALEPVAQHRIGVEPVEAMLKWSPAVAPGAQFVVAAAEALPLRTQSADLITAAGSLNYADPQRVFPEAARVLAPSGVLVVYDFSQGRGGALDAWFEEFMRRYPPAPDDAIEITPESLATLQRVFVVESHEHFEVGLAMTHAAYVEYALTETNVGNAITNGVPEEAIRSWCRQTLAPLFSGSSREVLFRGYIAYLRTASAEIH